MAWLTSDQIAAMGFASVGSRVFISDKASFHGCGRIRLGNDVRIDDFCVLSAGEGGIQIGNYIHIAVFCSLIGKGRIELADFSCLSSRVAVYSSNDDYSGNALTNPTVPEEYRNVTHGNVLLGRHVLVGSGSVLLPGITIGEGAAVGALSLVTNSCDPFAVHAGIPAKRIAERSTNLLDLERRLLSSEHPQG